MLAPIWIVLFGAGCVPIPYLLANAHYSRQYARSSARATVAPAEISVVVPVHGPWTERFDACLTSIAAQGGPFVVVGDGCLEPYRTATESMGGTFVHLPVNRGKKAALLAGLEQVSTPFVLFVDSDTVLPPEAAVRLASHMTPGIGGVGANLGVEDTGTWTAAAAEFVERSREVVLRAMSTRGSVPYLDGACVLHRTELIRPFLASAEFQSMRVAGRASRLGDDWQLTDFLLRSGWRTVKAYEVRVDTAPKATASGFVGQNVRWARSNWIRLGSYLRRGFPRGVGRFYAYEMTATYLLPLITLATLLSRLPLLAHDATLSSADAGATLLVAIHLVIGIPRATWAGLVHVSSMVVGAFATGAFLGATLRTSPNATARLVVWGAAAMGVMFVTSIYGLLTFWVEPRWAAPSAELAPGPAAARTPTPTEPV
ncbi:MAG TPA: glycosyltransferase [Thermoplasmata archaeon]|nr:glycosyltransferase [Thermoplasmata archaeon]